MGIGKKIWKAMTEETEEDRKRHTCKLCKRIFSEGYPYQYTMFGNPKSYVCMSCAKSRGLVI